MSKNVKLILILFILVVLPLILAAVNFYSAEFDSWGYNHRNQISNWMLVISVVGCLIIYRLSHRKAVGNNIWSTLSISLAVSLAIYWFIGNSISNFGF